LSGINPKPKEQPLSASLTSFKEAVEKLIRRFESDRPYYLSKSYSEAQARVDFITPFFKALGWDVENEAGLPHHQREVIVERGESETTGRPDYNFRIGGQTKFFVEAKAPSEGLDNPHHILQAKGYAWNTRSVFFVILTDFEGFRFYDASRQPDERNAEEGLLVKLKCAEYLENAEKLWDFSRERVAAGSLDALLPKIRRAPHLRKQVDDVFLDEMTGWREDLAKDIHKRNPALTAKQLNEVVQRLLDRIVFIRIAEDRHVIEKRQLAEVVEEWETHGGKFPIFDWLNALFHKINDDFNGEIFKPHLSEEIQVDSEILARIIKRLYPPKSPYRFDVIGVELLGSIYERYLGNTIRLTPKQVRVEEKPEVRKAGGVYYTPKYIVDYIVKNTVGKIIEGKSPKQIEKIRILDPACGSGSFLIGAFQYLIDYHTQWYLEHPEQEVRHAHPSLDFMREVRTDPDGSKRLSVYRKAKILRNNLFGVDIDPQAVEITMMSLYLKALEGEQSQLPPKQHLLPELKYNIMCGNSLIGPDIYDQPALFEDEGGDRFSALDWRDAFPAIMKARGFDVVIGNPPYIRMEEFKEIKRYLSAHYAVHEERSDIYAYFIERAHSLLKRQGRFGMIVSNKFLRSNYGRPLREFLNQKARIEQIIDFAGLPVFAGATVRTIVLITSRGPNHRRPTFYSPPMPLERFNAVVRGESSADEVVAQSLYRVRAGALNRPIWSFGTPGAERLLTRIRAGSKALSDYCDGQIWMGIKSGLAEAFVIDTETRSAILKRNRQAEEIIKPHVNGRDVRRYWIDRKDAWLIYTYHGIEMGKYPQVERHLLRFRTQLQKRATNQAWYELQQPQHNFAPFMEKAKIIFPDIATNPRFALDESGSYGSNTTYFIPRRDLYLLGLLNSRLAAFYFTHTCAGLEGAGETYLRFFGQYLEGFPLRTPDLSHPAEKAMHDRMVALVDRMLELNKKKHSGKLAPSELDRLEREISSTDQEIDELVYELYAVTDEEREVVEGRQT
jgi:type I restriction-modification system DNA methylase subunit